MSTLSFILFLFVASTYVYLAEQVVPLTVPRRFSTSVAVGITGAWFCGTIL